ncbi:LSU ribosomal protein L9P [Terriglobus roseus DSM 18391]|uniref:Large ribosomal subunit protein bL9 n=1 Tax=Terriglobus roseus (strain DSM 18391 / NRRL B-41598 / KBS 63) TaxID=926566 RepID=I3ZCB4_TERRK|nr:50S ribosomal protein L9 [Terriglobus roseus]AFL86882.1 LSU ribosomal protein L9P [Terriglobus roseus DSM 18391]
MEVILKEDVEKLGHRGDVVKVATGYGRNYLLPQRLAIEATVANKAVIVQMKESAVRKAVKDKTAATEQAEKLSNVEVTFERKVGANDVLFGSVTSQDIAAELAKQGYEIDRRKIALDEPLKAIGEFHVPVKLFREVSAHVKVTVKSDDPNYVPGAHAAAAANADEGAVRGRGDYENERERD